MTEEEIGTIIQTSQELIPVNDSRVAHKNKITEDDLAEIKGGNFSNEKKTVKVMRYLLNTLITRNGIKTSKKQQHPIPHLDKYGQLKGGVGTIEEYAEMLNYINNNFQQLKGTKKEPKPKKEKTDKRGLPKRVTFFRGEKASAPQPVKKKPIYRVSEMSDEQREWFKWFRQGVGLDLQGFSPDDIIRIAMTFNMSEYDNDPVYGKNRCNGQN